MNPTEYQRFLDELTSTLEADPAVVGLIALGSTADASSRDRLSDHDFWIITAPGSQSRYLDTFSWLPRAEEILMIGRHGASGRAVFYRDRHKAEYGVFDPEEAVRGKIEKFRVLLDRGDVWQPRRIDPASDAGGARPAALARPDRLENLCMLLWDDANERWERGERLSAQRYIRVPLYSTHFSTCSWRIMV